MGQRKEFHCRPCPRPFSPPNGHTDDSKLKSVPRRAGAEQPALFFKEPPAVDMHKVLLVTSESGIKLEPLVYFQLSLYMSPCSRLDLGAVKGFHNFLTGV